MRATRQGWKQALPRCVMAGDAVVIALTLVIAHSIRFGDTATTLASTDNIPYWQVGVAIGAGWFVALAIWRAWEIRILASSVLEYRRVVNATLAFFGALAIIAYVFEIELARGYVAVAVPVGVLLLLLWRWVARQVVVRLRHRGHLSRRLALIGGPAEVLQLYRSFARAPRCGLRPCGSDPAGPQPPGARRRRPPAAGAQRRPIRGRDHHRAPRP